jgi:hypothetical protein
MEHSNALRQELSWPNHDALTGGVLAEMFR